MKHIYLIIACIIFGGYIHAEQQQVDILPLEEFILTDSLASDSIENDSIEVVLLLTDLMENVIVHQDSATHRLLLDKYLGIERGQQEIDGFRVQVYSSNMQQRAKNESILLHQELTKKLSQAIYVVSEPPFWKVRVGNFRTRDEANLYKETLLDLFPELQSSTYVVPDKIIVLN